jgi:hypothetical protein
MNTSSLNQTRYVLSLALLTVAPIVNNVHAAADCNRTVMDHYGTRAAEHAAERARARDRTVGTVLHVLSKIAPTTSTLTPTPTPTPSVPVSRLEHSAPSTPISSYQLPTTSRPSDRYSGMGRSYYQEDRDRDAFYDKEGN